MYPLSISCIASSVLVQCQKGCTTPHEYMIWKCKCIKLCHACSICILHGDFKLNISESMVRKYTYSFESHHINSTDSSAQGDNRMMIHTFFSLLWPCHNSKCIYKNVYNSMNMFIFILTALLRLKSTNVIENTSQIVYILCPKKMVSFIVHTCASMALTMTL